MQFQASRILRILDNDMIFFRLSFYSDVANATGISGFKCMRDTYLAELAANPMQLAGIAGHQFHIPHAIGVQRGNFCF